MAKRSSGKIARPRSLVARIPRELEDVCLMALETNPERRYASATAFREDLECWLGGAAAPRAWRGGAVAGQVRNLRYFVRRHRVATIAAASVAAGVMLAAVMTGGPPRVTLVGCTISSPDQIDVELVTDSKVEVFIWSVTTDRENGTTTYLTLQPTGNRDSSRPLSTVVGSGATRLRLQTPDGRKLSSDSNDERRIQVFAATDDHGIAALRGAFDELAAAAKHEYAGLPGVPRNVAMTLLSALDLPGSKSGRTPGSAINAEQLLDGGSWDQDGVMASTMPLLGGPDR